MSWAWLTDCREKTQIPSSPPAEREQAAAMGGPTPKSPTSMLRQAEIISSLISSGHHWGSPSVRQRERETD